MKGVDDMTADFFKNQLLGLKAVLGSLQALSADICKGCIMLGGAKTKLGKMLNKLKSDLNASLIPVEEQKENIMASINTLSQAAQALPLAEEPT